MLRPYVTALAVLAGVLVVLANAAEAVDIDLVGVGNPGNVGELSGAGAGGFGSNRICGAVSYHYRIGKSEVTAGQYCEFLNAVAKTDTYGLYSTYMGSPTSYLGCNIQRTGSAGDFSYSVAADWANRPVNYVSWGDAARFCNWLSNGQPVGAQSLSTTEDGSYYLNGATANASLLAITRKPNSTWVIPSEDEWYKAAYYDPNKLGGAGYWDYATGTDLAPSNQLIDPDPGNNATFTAGSATIAAPYWRTEVGSHEASLSPYGTYDQGGNVWEWNESVVSEYASRCTRGGSFSQELFYLPASGRSSQQPVDGSATLGFRVALVASVPEPGSVVLAIAGGVCLFASVWRRRARAAWRSRK